MDYDTTGVILLTNDGDFSNFITHPSNKVPREYIVYLNRPLTEVDRQKLLTSVYLDNRKSKFQSVEYFRKNVKDRVEVATVEGRNHFVKRMFGKLGYFVKTLDRKSFGGLTSSGLRIGEYRKIAYSEIQKIYKSYEK